MQIPFQAAFAWRVRPSQEVREALHLVIFPGVSSRSARQTSISLTLKVKRVGERMKAREKCIADFS
jgi:hypothetical protein